MRFLFKESGNNGFILQSVLTFIKDALPESLEFPPLITLKNMRTILYVQSTVAFYATITEPNVFTLGSLCLIYRIIMSMPKAHFFRDTAHEYYEY